MILRFSKTNFRFSKANQNSWKNFAYKKSIVLQIVEEEVNVHAGDNLKLKCNYKVDPANRITSIHWSKNEEPIEGSGVYYGGDGTHGSIAIANVQKRHSGLYR